MASRRRTPHTRTRRIAIITTGRGLSAVAALAVAMLLPAFAQATTVRLGPEVTPSNSVAECVPGEGCRGRTYAQLAADDTTPSEAPASGLITSWRVAGFGPLRLRVLRRGPGFDWIGDGTSAGATKVNGEANATSLPIRIGEVIGVDLPAGTRTEIDKVEVPEIGNELRTWEPALADDGVPEAGLEDFRDEILVSANVVLAPVVSSVSPMSGSPGGGNTVTIGGLYLDGATGVSFGSTPASSFSVESSTQITAIVPAEAASTVDVRLTGPGGSSELGAADRYTFAAPAAATTAATTTAPAATTTSANPTPKTLIQGGPALVPADPAVTGFSQSAAKWRRGRSLPHISSAGGTPVGTTFSFSLNEPATATFTFTQSVAGRRAHGSCVVPSHGNAQRPKCKRMVLVGSVGVSGKAGLNKLRFQGRLSSAKTLKPGTYAVSITAHDAHGLKAVSRSLPFTIVS